MSVTDAYQKSSLHRRLQHFDAMLDSLQSVQQLQVVVYHEEEGAATDETVGLCADHSLGDETRAKISATKKL